MPVQRLFRIFLLLRLVVWLSQDHAHATTNVVSNTADSGAGSFRQAILEANANPGLDTIIFQISGGGVHAIAPAAALPPITDALIIDGTTQPGFAGQPLIELNGSSAGNNAGLRITSGNCIIRGLAINRFGGDGIRMEGSGTNLIRGNIIGTDSTGTIIRANGQEGILSYLSSANVIGGTNALDRNLISGNGANGIYLFNGGGNLVQGNFLGTSLNGTNALGNANNGIAIYGSAGNVIGGATSSARNLISGNRGSGIYLNTTAATSNVIQGNYIGMVLSGKLALSNTADGITLSSARANVIGGTNAGEGNVISGNGKAGVALSGLGNTANVIQGNFIGTDASGKSALGNGSAGVWLSGVASNSVGAAIAGARNIISGNLQDGVFILTNSTANLVLGNYIGLDVNGTNVIPNRFNGVSLTSATSNIIGGASADAPNVIAGNSNYGVQLAFAANANVVSGNYVGTDSTGHKPVPNRLSGFRIESAGNLVGGTAAGSGNVISGNREDGVFLVGASARSNIVQGNFVGTTLEGTSPLPNGRAGIGISGAPFNIIGGSVSGAANLLSGNGEAGIYMIDPGAAANQVLGNIIGADVTATAALPNGLEGIYLENSPSNIIGGNLPGAPNLISGNKTRGIFLTNASWNLIQGNLMGTKADGISPLGNVFHNLEFEARSTNNTVGGNRIAFAQGVYSGLRVRDGSLNNRFNGNAIVGNGGLGIDLDAAGVTLNDTCDTDTGANLLQNFPVLTQAVSGTGLGIRGTLNSRANTPFVIQFFANQAGDNAGQGEGEIYLGEINVTTAGDCSSSFVAKLPVSVPAGYGITATATDPAGNTSEFAACVGIASVPRLNIRSVGDHELTLTWSNSSTGFVLKQAASLAPPIQWSPVTNAPTTSGAEFLVTLLMGTTDTFYALSFE